MPPIDTDVPTNLLRPGSWQEFDVTSAARGLIPEIRRMAVIGQKTSAGTLAASTPTQVFEDQQCDDLAGIGSEAALMGRSALKAARKLKKQAQLFLDLVADPSGNAQARTLTCVGTASESGNIVLRLSGVVVRVGVTSGDTVTTQATAIAAKVNANKAILPFTASSSAGVATLTHNNVGTQGADDPVTVISVPAGCAVTSASSVAGTGSADIQAAVDALVDSRYHAIAAGTHVSGDVTILKTHCVSEGGSGEKRWCLAYMAEIGTTTAATTLASTGNNEYVVIISAKGVPTGCGRIAAQVAMARAAETKPNRSFNGVALDLPPCPLTSNPTTSVQETLLAAGVTPLALTDEQDTMKIVRLVTSKTTHNSVAFDALRDVSTVESLAYVASQVDARWAVAFQRADKSAKTKKAVYSETLYVLRQCEKIGVLQNVEAHKGELLVEDDPVNKNRLNVSIPDSVVPNLHQLVGHHVLFLE